MHSISVTPMFGLKRYIINTFMKKNEFTNLHAYHIQW